ncbi:MAG: hypothetical protein HZA90_06175 [Verrucomicrobia bacterium]|nr:hypothetical protein [Verrucomicrobiota bacterium]
MMRKAPFKIPPAVEWDFRAVTSDALPTACLYEYCRASRKVQQTARRYFGTQSNGKTIRERLIAAVNKRDFGAVDRLQIATGYFEDFGVWMGLEKPTGPLKDFYLPVEVFDLLTAKRPDFPEPWLAVPLRFQRNRRFSRIRIASRANVPSPANGWPPPSFDFAEFPGDGSWMPYAFDIEWPDATVEEITADFKRWLTREAKRHPEMKPAGKRGQAPAEPLKWLSALRLANAGLTFPQVKALLPVYVDRKDTGKQRDARSAGLNLADIPKAPPCGNGCGLLPKFADKSGFSDAIARAERKLAELESGNVESWLLNASP